jgi:hypothetical protein
MNKCIFCRQCPKHFSVEHLIPIKLMGHRMQRVTVTDAVCRSCNNKFGETVDAAFLNNDLVKLIRLRYRRFLPTKYLPKLIKENAKNLMDAEGNLYKLNAVVDKSGSRYMPSLEPQQQKGGEPTIFIRGYREAIQLAKSLQERKDVRIEIEPFLPKHALHGPIEMPIDSNLPFLDILYKMFIEFVHIEFGRQRALESTFDPIREALTNEGTHLGPEYKFKMLLNLPIDQLIKERNEVNGVHHKIGLSHAEQFWCFYFSMFGEAVFFCSLPSAEWYEQRNRAIDFIAKE